ncbi:MAG: hypothetical protein LBQ86_09310 [Holophagales bacterium]|nr:hypothetical protein [Holophagales bacterium]
MPDSLESTLDSLRSIEIPVLSDAEIDDICKAAFQRGRILAQQRELLAARRAAEHRRMMMIVGACMSACT